MATDKNFIVKNGLEVGGQEVISSSGLVTAAALGGQTLGTTDSPTFANTTLTGSLRGPATFTIDPAAVGDNTGTLVIAGNLQVDGTTTTINSTTMEVDDLNITLASGAANAAAANGAGITVDGASATITYDSTNDEWDFNKDINVTGTVTTDGLTTSADINFGNDDTAVFGDNSELKIYYDGYVAWFDNQDSVTKDTQIKVADGGYITLKAGNDSMIQAAGNSNVSLYYDGSPKLATTSTGIDVTGTATMDGLTVESNGPSLTIKDADSTSTAASGSIIFKDSDNSTSASIGYLSSSNSDFDIFQSENASIDMWTNSTQRLRINSSGNVGINTTAPATLLHIKADSNSATDFPLTIENAADSLDLGIGAYGLSNKVGTSQTSDFTMTIGDDLYLACDTVRLPDGADLIVQENDSTTSAIRLASDGDEGFLQVYRAGVQKVQIRGNGDNYIIDNNFGIGTASPVTLKSATTLQVSGNAKLGDDNGRGLLSLGDIASTGANVGIWRGAAGAYAGIGNYLNLGGYDGITFTTGAADISAQTERARITSTGDFLSNTTTAVSTFYNGASGLGFGYSAGGYGAVVRTATNTPLYVSTTGSGNTRFIEFYNGTTVRGGIEWNGSTLSAVTGSDYRLKENIAPIQNALTRINTLNPISYDMIDTGVSGEGFLAHEAQTVVPYAVIGTKDEVYVSEGIPEEKKDQIGQPKYQMMDYAKLTPLLVKAMQEQQTIIESLEARITALES